VFTRVLSIVLHPPVITTIVTTVTISLLLSIESQVAIDYLDVPCQLGPALPLLLLVLLLVGLLPQPDVLLLQLLVAHLWLLKEVLTGHSHRALKHFRSRFLQYLLIMLQAF
jgi:hypothetical protein